MSFYEYHTKSGDTGMFVVGDDVGKSFTLEARDAGRTDEVLVSVDPETLRDPIALEVAAHGLHFTAQHHKSHFGEPKPLNQ